MQPTSGSHLKAVFNEFQMNNTIFTIFEPHKSAKDFSSERGERNSFAFALAKWAGTLNSLLRRITSFKAVPICC